METHEIDEKFKDPQPWHPMTNSVDLKHLGKLAEELGECISAVSRCVIQGIDEKQPVTGKPNKEWLEDEIADVYANLQLVINRFNLNTNSILHRMKKKEVHLKAWHEKA